MIQELRVVVWNVVVCGQHFGTAVNVLSYLARLNDGKSDLLTEISSVCQFLLAAWAADKPSTAEEALQNPWRQFADHSLHLSQQEVMSLGGLFGKLDFLLNLMIDPYLLADEGIYNLLCALCWRNAILSSKVIISFMDIFNGQLPNDLHDILMIGKSLVRILLALDDELSIKRVRSAFFGERPHQGLESFIFTRQNSATWLLSWWCTLQLTKHFPFLSAHVGSYAGDIEQFDCVRRMFGFSTQRGRQNDDIIQQMCTDIAEEMGRIFRS